MCLPLAPLAVCTTLSQHIWNTHSHTHTYPSLLPAARPCGSCMHVCVCVCVCGTYVVYCAADSDPIAKGLAKPKSHSFTSPSLVIRMLLGLMSL